MIDPLFSPEINRLARSIRFAFVSILLGLAYLNIRSSLSIFAFQQIFRDMLNGKALPNLTQFVFSSVTVLIVVSLLVPSVAIGTLFSNRVISSFYLLGALSLLVMAQFIVLFYAFSAPLSQIINSMQGTP